MASRIDYVFFHKVYREQFRIYLWENFNQESIEFWIAVVNFRANPSKEKAIAIMDNFIVAGAPHLLNITHAVLVTLRLYDTQIRADRADALAMNPVARVLTSDTRKVDPRRFDEALVEAQLLLSNDPFPRWLKTENGKIADRNYQLYGVNMSDLQLKVQWKLGLSPSGT